MRQTILEIVLELLADSGVDDVHLIIANALHRRMTEAEMKRMVGEKIFDAYYPDRYYNHDAEDPDGMVELERTAHGRGGGDQPPRRGERPPHLREHQPRADGRRAQVGGHGPGELRSRCARTTTRRPSATPRATWSRRASALHRSTERIGRVIDKNLKVFHIETALNNRMFDGPTAFLGKKEEDYTEFDRLKFQGMKYALSKLPRRGEAEDVHAASRAPYEVTGVHAGATEPMPREDAGAVLEAVLGAGRGAERHRHLRHAVRLARTT